MTYIPHRRPLFSLHEAPQVSAEAISRDLGRALKRENDTTLEPDPSPLSSVFRAGFSRSELRLPQPPPLGSVAKTAHLLVPERESVKWDSSTRLFTFWIIFAEIFIFARFSKRKLRAEARPRPRLGPGRGSALAEAQLLLGPSNSYMTKHQLCYWCCTAEIDSRLQSCNLESISQGLVLGCLDADFCK